MSGSAIRTTVDQSGAGEFVVVVRTRWPRWSVSVCFTSDRSFSPVGSTFFYLLVCVGTVLM
jgi:hypothetical protein